MIIKTKHILAVTAVLLLTFVSGPAAVAGLFDTDDYVDKDDNSIAAWATGWQDYNIGTNVDEDWQTPELALGEAVGTSYDIVSLGRGGSITLTFDAPIINGEGADFAVFENSFSDTFLELAWVEVSTDGINFVRFDNYSGTQKPVSSYGTVDASNLYQLAGKHMQGLGTLFDLDNLQYNVDDPSNVDVNDIHYIRLVDIVGDGSDLGTWGHIIYDPYPTTGSAGFDLDAIGVLNQGTLPTINGDFNTDDDVDGSDLEEFIELYVNNYVEADLNEDNIIDFEDLMMFAENFGRTKK